MIPGDFPQPKILYSEIVREARFFLDEDGMFYPEVTTFILTGCNIHYLVNALNSKILEYAFKTFYAGGKLGEDGFRYKKQFLINLPIPIPCTDMPLTDEDFAKMFNFTEEERSFIESQQNQAK